MKTNGPDQRDCEECGKPIRNGIRVTLSDGRVICSKCHAKASKILATSDEDAVAWNWPPERMSDAKPKPKAHERHCWNCGTSMGMIEDRYYDRGDTCGKMECEREARYSAEAERDEAHEQLDRDMGWER